MSEKQAGLSIEELWKRTSADLAKMTAAERRQTLVDAGILTKKGGIASPYKRVLVSEKK